MIDWIWANMSTLARLAAVIAATWGAWKALLWLLERNPLSRLSTLESTMERHLDECGESNRIHTQKLDEVAEHVHQLRGMIEIIRDRLD